VRQGRRRGGRGSAVQGVRPQGSAERAGGTPPAWPAVTSSGRDRAGFGLSTAGVQRAWGDVQRRAAHPGAASCRDRRC